MSRKLISRGPKVGVRLALSRGLCVSSVVAVTVAGCAEGSKPDLSVLETARDPSATEPAAPPSDLPSSSVSGKVPATTDSGSRDDEAGVARSDASAQDPAPDSGAADSGVVDSGGVVADAATQVDSGPTSNACSAALASIKFDFEASDQGWSHRPSDNAASDDPNWPFDPWGRGLAATVACPERSCWASELLQNYAQCGRGELTSPPIDLHACAGERVTLVFRHAFAFWSGTVNRETWYDGGIVEISSNDGASWVVPPAAYPGTVKILGKRNGIECVRADGFHVHDKPGFTGKQYAPSTVEIDVPSSALTSTMRVRFSQGSGVSTASNGQQRGGTAAGWRVDDVHFVRK